jgi:hypothetical protein
MNTRQGVVDVHQGGASLIGERLDFGFSFSEAVLSRGNVVDSSGWFGFGLLRIDSYC